MMENLFLDDGPTADVVGSSVGSLHWAGYVSSLLNIVQVLVLES
jgi:hypothetical protein